MVYTHWLISKNQLEYNRIFIDLARKVKVWEFKVIFSDFDLHFLEMERDKITVSKKLILANYERYFPDQTN